jgi:hypothetical protein
MRAGKNQMQYLCHFDFEHYSDPHLKEDVVLPAPETSIMVRDLPILFPDMYREHW